MSMYETVFILDSLLAPEEIDKVIDRVKELIESNGGKVLTVDKWGKRRLAYEIQKKQYGFYVAIEFEGEGPIPNSLESEFNFSDKVLRYLTYKYTKNKIKARAIEIETRKNQLANVEAPEIMAESNGKTSPDKTPGVKSEEKDDTATEVRAEKVSEEKGAENA